MEYISKDKTLKKLQMQLLDLEAEQDKGEYSELCENRGARDALDEAINDIRTIKGEDVQPVKRGRWVHDGSGYDRRDNWYHCSECNRALNLICGKKLEDYPYCHCGARMDLKDGEQNV